MIVGILKTLFGNGDEIQVINGIKLTNNHIRTLKDYKIDYNVKDIKKLLDNIYLEELYHVDEKGIRADEHFDILDDLYWDIKKLNKK